MERLPRFNSVARGGRELFNLAMLYYADESDGTLQLDAERQYCGGFQFPSSRT